MIPIDAPLYKLEMGVREGLSVSERESKGEGEGEKNRERVGVIE